MVSFGVIVMNSSFVAIQIEFQGILGVTFIAFEFFITWKKIVLHYQNTGKLAKSWLSYIQNLDMVCTLGNYLKKSSPLCKATCLCIEYCRSKMRGQIGHLCLILPSFWGKITLIRLPDLSGDDDRAPFDPLLLWITPLGGAMFSCSFKCFCSSSELENPRLHSKHGQELISSSRAKKK